VTLVEMAARAVLAREEPQAGALVARSLQDDGVRVLTGHEALRVEAASRAGRGWETHEAGESGEAGEAREARESPQPPGASWPATPGRRWRSASTSSCVRSGASRASTGFGLEELGLALTPEARPCATDAFQRTRLPNIYAVGDVAGPLQFTHAAAHGAWHAAVNALFGRWKRFRSRPARHSARDLHRPRSGARGPRRRPRPRQQGVRGGGDAATRWRSSTVPSPTAAHVASCRCSPPPGATASWA
jgi:hypothetical protein